MSGYKEFDALEILSATDVNGFLMNQSNLVFEDETDRDNQVAAPVEGMRAYLTDNQEWQEYDGEDWLSQLKIIQQETVVRTTDVINTDGSTTICDEMTFTPKQADSLLLMEWAGTGFVSRFAGTVANRQMFLTIRDVGPTNNIRRATFGVTLSGSTSLLGLLSPFSLRGVYRPSDLSERTFRTLMEPLGLNLRIESQAQFGNPNRFTITEFAKGPVA
jgi:hypothetical protein